MGLTIYQEYIDRFELELSRYVSDHLRVEQIKPPLIIEHELNLYDVNEFLMDWMERFAPFGRKINDLYSSPDTFRLPAILTMWGAIT